MARLPEKGVRKRNSPDIRSFNEYGSPGQPADQGNHKQGRMVVNDMKKTEGQGGYAQKKAVSQPREPLDFRE